MDLWHYLDFLTKFRRWVYPKIHEVVSIFGGFAESRETPATYVGSVKMTLDGIEEVLDEEGFMRNIVASVKYRDVSRGDKWTKGSWAYYPDGVLSDNQVHLILYSAFDDGYVDIYAHHEPSWLTHPVKHYSTDYVNTELGVSMARDILSDKVSFYHRPKGKRVGEDA